MSGKRIAIVTGASSGMGREFAKKIATTDVEELWLIGLNEKELNLTKQQIQKPCVCFSLDLTKLENLETIKQTIKESNVIVSWLVNASGYGKFGRYDEIKLESSIGMIDLNCRALVYLTEASIPYMEKGSRIVQFGSVAGFQPIPYIATYGATKAFVISYSRAMNVELKSKGISVTCVCPYWTKTNFFKRATEPREQVVSKYIVMYDPIKVVEKAFKDSLKRKELSIKGFVARSQVRLVKIVPTKWVMGIWVKQQNLTKKYKKIDATKEQSNNHHTKI